MMQYRAIKNALTQMIGDQSAGRFQVIGYQRETKGQNELTGNNRTVQVYYSEGQFPKSSGMRGAKKHDITIEIDLAASAAAKGDISVLDSDSATPQQKAAALLAVKTAAEEADRQIDELIDAVWNILFDARNERLDLPIGDTASRWIDRIQKDTQLAMGDLVVKTANMKYTCRVMEQPLGEIGNLPDPAVFNSTLTGDIDGAGVIQEDN